MNPAAPTPLEPAGFGALLPSLRVRPPGPRSRAGAVRLAAVESPAISTLANGDLPIFWQAAAGANVMDVDGNIYIDTTSGFGVASIGHRHPLVVRAIREQAGILLHGMGDFLPCAPRLELAEALQRVLPPGLTHVLFGITGADAVELAIKCATAATGHPGVIAFEGAFHGQSYGTLALAGRAAFSRRFGQQLGVPVARAPFPSSFHAPAGLSGAEMIELSLTGVRRAASELAARGTPAGCVIVEPCQGREGDRIPPHAFLPALRACCRELGLLLICDEIYTGFGRTGAMWAHGATVPDLLCAGKALGGGVPISIVAGRSEIMAAWQPDGPEAPHSSTFLANPLACAAALAVLSVIEHERMVERALSLGDRLLPALQARTSGHSYVGEVRGRGAMIGIELVRSRAGREPYPELVPAVLQAGLEAGLILLPSGARGNVISLSPPFVCTDEQLDYVADVLPKCLGA